VLEEDQEGNTFSRHVRYRLTPSPIGTSVQVENDVSFNGLGKLAAPIASRDIKKRWGARSRSRGPRQRADNKLRLDRRMVHDGAQPSLRGRVPDGSLPASASPGRAKSA
jgi:hypothetical protein